jgi:hypothetical protein
MSAFGVLARAATPSREKTLHHRESAVARHHAPRHVGGV